MSRLEAALALQIRAAGLSPPVPQMRPIAGRKFRADFGWPGARLLVEVQGGIWTLGRHNRGSGYEQDCARLNELTLAGWRVLYVTERHIREGDALRWIERALGFPVEPRD